MYANDISGMGAKIAGGRWNKKGIAVLYTSNAISLCLLEILVHIPASFIPKNMVLVTIDVPDNCSISTINGADLPKGWNTTPAPSKLQYFTKPWLDSNIDLMLRVPNAIVPAEFNFLINPYHHDFNRVKVVDISDFCFDTRLLK